ncbi:MAG: NTPase [Synergistetes bacterium]|nr:NTPase [Synergistota bacterium]
MRKHLILTGPPGVGKTTLLKKLMEGVSDARGFFTEEIREGGRRRGFKLITLSGRECVLAHESLSSPYRVGKYGVNLSDFEKIGVGEIEKGLSEGASIIVIDEIGKMELFSRRFEKALLKALDSLRVVATMGRINHPVVKRIRARKDVEIIEVRLDNRSILAHQLRIFQSSSPSE